MSLGLNVQNGQRRWADLVLNVLIVSIGVCGNGGRMLFDLCYSGEFRRTLPQLPGTVNPTSSYPRLVDLWTALGLSSIRPILEDDATSNLSFKELVPLTGLRPHGASIVGQISFEIKYLWSNSPFGFLFLCPQEEYRNGPASFGWPDCPAYWSLDRSGVKRLNTDEATALGFPLLEFNTRICCVCGNSSVYAEIRSCHEAKSFDPYSQDIAILCHPRFELSRVVSSPFDGKSSVLHRSSR